MGVDNIIKNSFLNNFTETISLSTVINEEDDITLAEVIEDQDSSLDNIDQANDKILLESLFSKANLSEREVLKHNDYIASKNYILSSLRDNAIKMGADAMDNIYYTKYLIDNKYDGIIHIKSSFCTPEIGSMSVINKMCEENDMPVLFMSMDINTSKVGMETRLEAFYDMIEMRKRNE